ncbi:MAG: hypothetical protein ACRDYX_07450 [Egibacteraceae bacterium]
MVRLLAALALLAVLLTGCGGTPAGSGPSAVRPRDGRSGLHLAGVIRGQQLAVSDGLPRLEATDCDPNDGADQDVCVVSRTIDGTPFVVVFENPAVLEPGTLRVESGGCARPEDCDRVAGVAVIEVRAGVRDRVRAQGGSLTLEVVEPGRRYVGSLSLELPNGRIDGDFDLIPRPEP